MALCRKRPGAGGARYSGYGESHHHAEGPHLGRDHRRWSCWRADSDLVSGNTTEIEDIVFQDNTISTLTSATDLTLSSSGTSFVTIDGILKMPVQAGGASINPGTNIAIYGKDPAIGNSGVWYKNKDAYEDELISTNRSLLFSMLF